MGANDKGDVRGKQWEEAMTKGEAGKKHRQEMNKQ